MVRLDLAEVADVYRRAVSAGQPPTVAVAQRFGITRTYASRFVMRARDAGLLPPAADGWRLTFSHG